MTLDEAHNYLRGRLDELKVLYPSLSAWVFLCAASYLEYLAKIVNGRDLKASGYKEFIRTWLARTRPAYAKFAFGSGTTDLPEQMYHVLRSGLVHSFSLVPDAVARSKGGRDRSIVLCHRAESVELGLPHLSKYVTSRIPDGVLFVAEDFVDDIAAVTDEIFRRAKTDSGLASNIQA